MKNQSIITMHFPIYIFKWSPNDHKVVRYEGWGIEYGKIVKKPEQNVVVARGGIVRVGYEKNNITHGIDIKVMPGVVYNNIVWLPTDNFGNACTRLRVKYLYAMDDVRKKLNDIERIIDIIGEQEENYMKNDIERIIDIIGEQEENYMKNDIECIIDIIGEQEENYMKEAEQHGD